MRPTDNAASDLSDSCQKQIESEISVTTKMVKKDQPRWRGKIGMLKSKYGHATEARQYKVGYRSKTIWNFILDNWTCLPLKDLLLEGCFDSEIKPTEPFEVDVPSTSFPSFFFITEAAEALLRLKGFSFLLLPRAFWGLDCFEWSSFFTSPS